ncbi:ROK family protein [Candidatus Protochlamydia amoebophila]|uniref:Glucokinase n=1 Tax=Candidatus Protochlamydia amoebophila TaxID=362787 RepID=A0A0C1JXZ1_9BACT|nr:ROK family protein [Candidatus Protochlamydia amoebophila]KIC72062.1 Glucokinase [Candidatus Protochlamydia amoebophila]
MLKETDCVIGIDLGGTKIGIGILNVSGTLIDSVRLKTDSKHGPASVEKQIMQAIQDLKNRTKVEIKGIGIGVAGQIDEETGVVRFAPNLPGWHQVTLRENLEREAGIPVKVVNDVRAITWGEWFYGAGKHYQDLICLFVGTGIGSGIVCQGKMQKGDNNTFGEVGHMTIDFHGPRCTCGNNGCFEAFAGGWGIARQAKELILADNQSGQSILEKAGGYLENVSAKAVIEAYHSGDPLALLILEKVKQALIAGCVNLVNAFNPACLILGGGVLDGIPEILSFIDKGIREIALKTATDKLQIKTALLGKNVGIIGSGAVILDVLKNNVG